MKLTLNEPVNGMFVIGSDHDNKDTIKQTVKFCRQTGLYSAQFSILFPIPGTRLYQQLDGENRILTKDWSLYDGTHVVFRPKRFTPMELQKRAFWAWKKFYSSLRISHYLVCRSFLQYWRLGNRKYVSNLRKWTKQFAAART